MDEKKELSAEEIEKVSGGSKVDDPSKKVFEGECGRSSAVRTTLKAYGGPPITPGKINLPVMKYGGPPINPTLKPGEDKK